MSPGVSFVSDHMTHNVRQDISEQPVSLKCCHRYWLNQMEGKNLPIGIIFDLDGTLIDSEPVHMALYQEIAHSLGYSLSDAEYYSKLRGMTDEETVDAISQMADKKGNRKRLIEEKQRKFAKRLSEGEIKPLNGAVAFVRELHNQGHLLALATSAIGAEAQVALRGLGLTDLFSAVLSAENILHGKPAPDAYLNAARALSLPPKECLVYEDSLAGVQAALAAGIEVVAIGDTRNEMLHHSGAKLVISDFTGHVLPETG
jgi:beta-phosphoglucomutase